MDPLIDNCHNNIINKELIVNMAKISELVIIISSSKCLETLSITEQT